MDEEPINNDAWAADWELPLWMLIVGGLALGFFAVSWIPFLIWCGACMIAAAGACFRKRTGRRALVVLLMTSPFFLLPQCTAVGAVRGWAMGDTQDWERATCERSFRSIDSRGRYYPSCSVWWVSMEPGRTLTGFLNDEEEFILRLLTDTLGPGRKAYLGDLPGKKAVEDAMVGRAFMVAEKGDNIILADGSLMEVLPRAERFMGAIPFLAACGPSVGPCATADWIAMSSLNGRDDVVVFARATGAPLTKFHWEEESSFSLWLWAAHASVQLGEPIIDLPFDVEDFGTRN